VGLKLNVGSGNSKIEGTISIDCEESCKPDLLLNFCAAALPYEEGSVEEIYFFHTVEHIQKRFHGWIFQEFARVLQVGGQVFISYPNFEICSKLFIENSQGRREFWEKTLYGRQLYPSDYHVCAMIPQELHLLLGTLGFEDCQSIAEPGGEFFNTVTRATKGTGKAIVGYEGEVGKAFREDTYQLVTP
jgi:hypothetical protein